MVKLHYSFENLLLYPWVQSLKRSTFPFFAFAHRSLTVRSACNHSAFINRSPFAHGSQYCVHVVQRFARVSRSQSIHRSLTVLSVTVHKTSSFADRSQSVPTFSFGTPTWKDCSEAQCSYSDKIRRNVCRRMGENVLCISEISLLITKRQDY